ncbi:MAG: hypothetical protein GYA24_21990 [Candidatus Lokiarchaeota archaeon]|nr:hypothetical protein [Candidatus Lokiarchaeota archaeon]
MTDMMARACFNCHAYIILNAGSTRNQSAMGSFDKDHARHMVQTVAFNELDKGYVSHTRRYVQPK